MALFKKHQPIEKSQLLFSHGDLWKIFIPMMLQQVLNVTVGTVDSMMVSSAGEAAVSGVSLINTLDTLLIIFFTAMVSGGSVVVAQALGRKNRDDICESAKQLMYIVTALATLLTTVVLLLRRPLLSLLFGDVAPDVMENAQGYFFFVALSFPLLAIIESAGACFRASGHTMISLLVSISINIMNVIGNAVLIYGFDMGAAGAAIATTVARLCGAVILLILIHQKRYEVHVERLLRYKPDFSIIKRILHIGVPHGIENAMFQFGRLLTQTLISTMGTAVIAANAVALTVSNFQYMVGTACSVTMVTVVGRCIGAGDERQAKYYSRILLGLNYLVLWIVILGTAIFLGPLVGAYDLSGESAELAKQLILYHAVCAAVVWPVGFMLPSAFRAASDVRFSLVVSMATMWIFRVAGGYVMALDSVSVFGLFTVPGLGMGVMGVWVAMTVDWLFRFSLFLWRYLSGSWLRARLSPEERRARRAQKKAQAEKREQPALVEK